jgi:predicted MFS family arabinose efflux permease
VARRGLLLAGVVVFALGALAAALAPTWPALLGARALMAIGAGLVTPVAASVAVALARPEERGRALSLVFGGLTLAQVLGVPAGAWLGYAFGWPLAFATVAALSCLAAWLLRGLPADLQSPATDLSALVRVLRSGRLTLAVSFTGLFIGGIYCVYTFLAPLFEERLGLGRDGVTFVLLVFGIGAVLGNAMGGFLNDHIGSARTLAILCGAQVVLMPLITLVPLPALPAGALIAVWSVFGWSFMVPQQARLSALAPELTSVLFALNAAAIYLGASVGSAAGGQTLHIGGFGWLGLTGAMLVVGAAATLVLVRARTRPQSAHT